MSGAKIKLVKRLSKNSLVAPKRVIVPVEMFETRGVDLMESKSSLELHIEPSTKPCIYIKQSRTCDTI